MDSKQRMIQRIPIIAAIAILFSGSVAAFADDAGVPNTAALAKVPSVPASPPPVVVADPKILALFNRVEAKLKSLKSLSVETESVMKIGQPGQKLREVHYATTYEVQRPSYVRCTSWSLTPGSAGGKTIRKSMGLQQSDGKDVWYWDADDDRYGKSPLDLSSSDTYPGLGSLFSGFFRDAVPVAKAINGSKHKTTFPTTLDSVTMKENQPWHGGKYIVVEVVERVSIPERDINLTTRSSHYIGQDMLIHRTIMTTSGYSQDEWITSIKTDPKFAKDAFKFIPPPGAGFNKPGIHAKPEAIAKQAPAPPVLANGSAAPDFTVQDADGKPVKLSDYAGKVVVIDFWATWCGPCMASMPHTNDVARKFKDKDVVFLAINTSDSEKLFKEWLPKHKELDALVFVRDGGTGDKNISSSLYKVTGIPTQFVIDKSGKVTHSFVGYGGPTPDLENAIVAAGG